ncbi:phasin family protein [Bradyrhizobium sp. OAE829]|uniref:phasin family protein n=1 Tax=Bradyrhizobium sp. OAE829 TaxID=2663807 RepID=UPI003395ADDD
MVRHHVEKSMDRMNQLWTCRTPQELAAVQTDVVRETIETALESSRRIADLSLKMADETGKQIKKNMEVSRRAA